MDVSMNSLIRLNPTKKGRTLVSAAIVLLLSLVSLRGETVTVFAAASLTDSLKEIGAAYERQSGDKVLFNLGASSVLARQIEEGAPADIFFSADEAKMDRLERQGLILKDTRKSLLSNSLVIVVASDHGAAVSGPRDLATDRVKLFALAEPSAVPAGIYAKEYLQQQGLWDAVAAKVVPTENVRAALSAVESGNADAGIVYKTDALISKSVKVAYEVPINAGPKISYPVAVVKESEHIESAKKFLEYLESKAAAGAFRKYGFVVRE